MSHSKHSVKLFQQGKNSKQTLKQMKQTVWMLMNQKQYSGKLLNAVVVHEQYIALKGAFVSWWNARM